MINVKVLGPGCPKCQRLEATVRRVVKTHGVEAQIDKVRDLDEILKYRLLAMPGLVIAEKLVAAGRVPHDAEIAAWLAQAVGEPQLQRAQAKEDH